MDGDLVYVRMVSGRVVLDLVTNLYDGAGNIKSMSSRLFADDRVSRLAEANLPPDAQAQTYNSYNLLLRWQCHKGRAQMTRFTCFISVLLISSVFACDRTEPPSKAKSAMVEECWQRNMLVIDRIHLGASGLQDEVNEASEFLYLVTRIDIRWNIAGAMGLYLVSDESREDMERLHAWYQENKEFLYWDQEARQVLWKRPGFRQRAAKCGLLGRPLPGRAAP